MPLPYNPSDFEESAQEFEGWPDGEYNFTIESAVEKETKGGPKAKLPAGTPYCGLELMVHVSDEKSIRSFYNLFFQGKGLFFTNQFINGIGLNFDKPPEYDELVGLDGRGYFKKNADGYLNLQIGRAHV